MEISAVKHSEERFPPPCSATWEGKHQLFEGQKDYTVKSCQILEIFI